MFKDKNEFKRFAKNLNRDIFNYYESSVYKKKWSDYSNHNEPRFWHYSIIKLTGSLRCEFRKWAEKPFYLVLFKGNRILLELDLSRIINNDKLFSWYLSFPTNKETYKVFKANLKMINKIPKNYYADLKDQKKKFDSGIVVPKSGFKLTDNSTYHILFNDLMKLIDEMIRNDILLSNKLDKKGLKQYSINDVEAEEGYQEDKTYLLTKRNSAIVKRRKEIDNYSCQVCGFKLYLNSKYVIECHHLKPLSAGKVRVTNTNDLISLCPTCHRVAHLTKPPYSIKELKRILNAT